MRYKVQCKINSTKSNESLRYQLQCFWKLGFVLRWKRGSRSFHTLSSGKLIMLHVVNLAQEIQIDEYAFYLRLVRVTMTEMSLLSSRETRNKKKQLWKVEMSIKSLCLTSAQHRSHPRRCKIEENLVYRRHFDGVEKSQSHKTKCSTMLLFCWTMWIRSRPHKRFTDWWNKRKFLLWNVRTNKRRAQMRRLASSLL